MSTTLASMGLSTSLAQSQIGSDCLDQWLASSSFKGVPELTSDRACVSVAMQVLKRHVEPKSHEQVPFNVQPLVPRIRLPRTAVRTVRHALLVICAQSKRCSTLSRLHFEISHGLGIFESAHTAGRMSQLSTPLSITHVKI